MVQSTSHGNTQRSALRAFGIQSGAVPSEEYISVPVSWTQDDWNASQRAQIFDNPVSALGGPESALGKEYFSVVFGPAGVGKSELLKELCRTGESSPRARKVFPVRLSSCHLLKPGSGHAARAASAGLQYKDDLTPAKLGEFLFSALAARENLNPETFMAMSFETIARGQMVLALDGLDEVISSTKLHNKFFESLWGLLRMWLPRGFRLIVSCRSDYLSALGVEGRSDFGQSRLPVHFLGLDFFNISRVKFYLFKKHITSGPLKDAADLLDKSARGLGEMMQRPLLLTLLCKLDALEQKANASPLPSDTTALLEKLTREAEKEQSKGAIHWRRDKLAAASLTLFTRPSKAEYEAPAFRVGEIDSFVDLEETQHLTDEERWVAINPCPFLRRDNETDVQFTHSIFYEYFVARGMFLQLEHETQSKDSLIDFDRYVLTPEMRRFLRGSLSEKRWRERTRRSYCLENREGALDRWPDRRWAAENFDELERIRYGLLGFITEPEDYGKEQAVAMIEEYLQLDQERLFPAYRMYNLEAVAVFLGTYRWHPKSREMTQKLEKILGRLLDGKHKEEREHEGDSLYLESLEQLALKIVDIGRRLKISTIMNKKPAA